MSKVAVNLVFASSLFFICFCFTLYSTSQDGTSASKYQSYNNVFYDQEYARGFVRLANGFTVAKKSSGVGSTHGSCAFMDTCISVSGAIDLRETNTMFLQADLILDNGVTFSSSGNIYGYDRALILNGDLTIPDGKIIHTGGRIIIDGNGHKLILGNSSQLFVDTDATLTLRNLVLQNTRNQPGHPAVQCAASGSKLCFDDVELALADDFYFNQGQFFIHNDVVVTGTSAFIYNSTNPSCITFDSTFYFNPSTTFDFRPSTTGTPQLLAKDLLIMQDGTSKLYLNGCTLKTTMTGLCLTKGQIIFDNKVSLTSASQLKLKGMGNWMYANYGTGLRSIKWSPDGRYLAIGGYMPTSGNEIQIYKFTDSSLTLVTSLDYGTYANSVSWSPDGLYLAVIGMYSTSGKEVQIYKFIESSLILITSLDYGSSSECYSGCWSPDGKYLAVCGYGSTSGNDIQVYKFTGHSLTLAASRDYGTFALTVNWSPDGKYLAVGGQASTSGNEIQVYNFNGSSLTLITSKDYGTRVNVVNWSPDGRYLAVGGQSPTSGNEIQIYKFTESSLTLVTSLDYGNNVYTVSWSPDGRYLTVGGQVPASGNAVQIYKFVGSSLILVTAKNYGAYVMTVNWSADGRYLALGGQTPNLGHDEIEVYTLQYGPENDAQTLSNAIIFGNSSLGSDYDLNVRVLAGAQVTVDGLLNDDNVN